MTAHYSSGMTAGSGAAGGLRTVMRLNVRKRRGANSTNAPAPSPRRASRNRDATRSRRPSRDASRGATAHSARALVLVQIPNK